MKKYLKVLAIAALSVWALVVTIPVAAQVYTSISLADGSRSAPSVTFLADATAGLYRAPGTGNTGVAGGIALPRIFSAQTPGSQAANTCAPQSFTVTGVAVTDQVWLMNYPATGNATGYGMSSVTALNTVAQTVCNPTAGALTPAAGTFVYAIVKTQ